ncbi:MAG: twin-arginine translocase TatA/TatE family subunit [Alphaproteobacteria bacterium]|nr:twin-arginine translocase TatA/TatE family subunit [Alphaproteobacteria bacterium]
MGLSIWHILVVLIVVLVVFGAGKIPSVMGDLGKGIRNFKSGLNGEAEDKSKKDEDQPRLPPSKQDTL